MKNRACSSAACCKERICYLFSVVAKPAHDVPCKHFNGKKNMMGGSRQLRCVLQRGDHYLFCFHSPQSRRVQDNDGESMQLRCVLYRALRATSDSRRKSGACMCPAGTLLIDDIMVGGGTATLCDVKSATRYLIPPHGKHSCERTRCRKPKNLRESVFPAESARALCAR